jgi:hypothetical protein
LPWASKSVPGNTVHQAWETHFLYSIKFQLIPIALDLKIQNISLLGFKIFQTCHGGRFQPIVQLSPWAQLEIPKGFLVIYFGTKIDLIFHEFERGSNIMEKIW